MDTGMVARHFSLMVKLYLKNVFLEYKKPLKPTEVLGLFSRNIQQVFMKPLKYATYQRAQNICTNVEKLKKNAIVPFELLKKYFKVKPQLILGYNVQQGEFH